MKRKRLRTGFTTGTAAAAAAKAAMLCILRPAPPAVVDVELLTGQWIVIPVHTCRRSPDGSAVASVIKDAGDDPDVTHGAEIGARVERIEPRAGVPPGEVHIRGGAGVGRVTKPGLEVAPGEPAINPGPRRMITRAVQEALAGCGCAGPAAVEIFVPRGEEISRKTLNARLGILGGISILGTTGIVRPMSHEAFAAAIESALSVAKAAGLSQAVLTTGRRSERHAQNLWPALPEEAFVQIGDFFQKGLELSAAKGFDGITLAVFFGKALKMARGAAHTHAAKSELTLQPLAGWAAESGAPAALCERIRQCNTAREAFGLIARRRPELIGRVGEKIIAAARAMAGARLRVRCVILDYEGAAVYDSAGKD
jgi:cobalt-precorrin-5B (C1)-methyltransferase